MASPVELSDLPIASSASNSDLLLLRKGLTDYQCAVGLIRNINVAALSSLPGGTSQSTDLFLISRTISGTPQNFQIPFYQVSFPKGTRMWFWQGLPPTGWSIINGTGDRLLAVASQDAGYDSGGGGSQTGTWQQRDVGGVAGQGLTVAQMPLHGHQIKVRANAGSNPTGVASGSSGSFTTIGSATANDPIQMTGSNAGVGATSSPHNHGNNWRPLANVGVLGNKDN